MTRHEAHVPYVPSNYSKLWHVPPTGPMVLNVLKAGCVPQNVLEKCEAAFSRVQSETVRHA